MIVGARIDKLSRMVEMERHVLLVITILIAKY
jgi:hypothetical protein